MLSEEQLHELATGYFADQWAVDKAIMLMQEVEAEVRKQDDALIQQMLEAIEAETSDTWFRVRLQSITIAREPHEIRIPACALSALSA